MGESIALTRCGAAYAVLSSIAGFQRAQNPFFHFLFWPGIVLAAMALGLSASWLFSLNHLYHCAPSGSIPAHGGVYDSMLTDVTTDERMDVVSLLRLRHGLYRTFAFHFVAAVCWPYSVRRSNRTLRLRFPPRLLCGITAVWWLIFTMPSSAVLNSAIIKRKNRISSAVPFTGSAIRFPNSAGKTVLYFILAYFFYIDGVHTIIKMATSHGAALGIDSTQLILALLVTQIVAFPSAISLRQARGEA